MWSFRIALKSVPLRQFPWKITMCWLNTTLKLCYIISVCIYIIQIINNGLKRSESGVAPCWGGYHMRKEERLNSDCNKISKLFWVYVDNAFMNYCIWVWEMLMSSSSSFMLKVWRYFGLLSRCPCRQSFAPESTLFMGNIMWGNVDVNVSWFLASVAVMLITSNAA